MLQAEKIPDDLVAATMRSTAMSKLGRPGCCGRLSVRHRALGHGRSRVGFAARIPFTRRQAPADQSHPVRRGRQPRELRRGAGDHARRGRRYRHGDFEPHKPAFFCGDRLCGADRKCRGRGGRTAVNRHHDQKCNRKGKSATKVTRDKESETVNTDHRARWWGATNWIWIIET